MENELYISDFKTLFEAVQSKQIFGDQKIMADAIPLFPIEEINKSYEKLALSEDFDLKKFILHHFKLKEKESKEAHFEKKPLMDHIEEMWDFLERDSKNGGGTLLRLPKPYVVPGGRFEEFFYWDSYFIILGLMKSGRVEMIRNILDNAAFLIDAYGFYPNGNRTYFLSRSQIPFFGLMISALAEATGDPFVYDQYGPCLEKEYAFWMQGSEDLKIRERHRRVVKLDEDVILNRYYDEREEPRPESYLYDLREGEGVGRPGFYREIRAACESGWDFSSRWFRVKDTLKSTRTLELIPVDLNCLLWFDEQLLAQFFSRKGNTQKESFFKWSAEKRRSAIQKYCWEERTGLYKDYNFEERQLTLSEHLGTVFPLFFELAGREQANAVAENLEKKFLKPGGLITTTFRSGQQWDAPNAWAPLQYMAWKGLRNYGFEELAREIADRWCSNVERVYKNTGKLMEKYDAMDLSGWAGGGEYPNQDGFGWTNGVYQQLKSWI